MEHSNNAALYEAVNNGNVPAVRELLEQGGLPDLSTRLLLIEFFVNRKNVEVIKLLIASDVCLNYTLMEHIFMCETCPKELISLFFEYTKYMKFIETSLLFLICNSNRRKSGLKFLEHLLDQGLPIDTFISYKYFTPLQLSVIYKRIDIVSKRFYLLILKPIYQNSFPIF